MNKTMLTLKENTEKLEEIRDMERELSSARNLYDGIQAVIISHHRHTNDFQRQAALVWLLAEIIVKRLDSTEEVKDEVLKVANILEDQVNKLFKDSQEAW